MTRSGGGVARYRVSVPATPPPSRRAGVLAGAGAYLMWGLFPLYFHGLKAVRPIELAGWRIVLTALVVWGTLRSQGDLRWFAAVSKDRKRLLLVSASGLVLTMNWLVYVWAVGNGHVVDAAIGYFINPLMSVALGVVLLHERLRVAHQWALALGTASVCVLTFAYGNVPWVALSLAGTFAVYGYLKKIAGLDGLRALAAETLPMVPLGLIGLVVLGAQDGGLDAASNGTSVAVLTALVGVVSAVPLVLFGVAAKRIPLALIGLLQYVTPVGQLACGVLVFGETVSPARWAGIALVGVALSILAIDLYSELRPTRSSIAS